MAFGSLFTLIGYHFGNIDNNIAETQRIPRENAQDELRCRSLYLFYFGGILPFLDFAERLVELDDLFHERHAPKVRHLSE